MGIITMVAQAAFDHTPEVLFDFVTNPANWVKTYPGSKEEEGLPPEMPLKAGDCWAETGPRGERYSWQVATTLRPSLWVCNTLGRLGHDRDGGGGVEGRIQIEYRFWSPGPGMTIFQRSYITESFEGTVLPDVFLTSMNPAHAETYFAGIARELAKA